MHSYTWGTSKAKEEVTFNYNGDLSGEVTIMTNDKEVCVTGHALLAFVAYCYVLPNKLEEIENKDWPNLLK